MVWSSIPKQWKTKLILGKRREQVCFSLLTTLIFWSKTSLRVVNTVWNSKIGRLQSRSSRSHAARNSSIDHQHQKIFFNSFARLFNNHRVRILYSDGWVSSLCLYSPKASPARCSFHVLLWPIAANKCLSLPPLNCLVSHTYHPICRTQIPNYSVSVP